MSMEFSRTEMLLGSEAMKDLAKKRVAIFGVGGVGGYVAEALGRTGIGSLDLFDNDTVSLSNINRQIIALHSTVGMPKVSVMKNRLLDINPQIIVQANALFYSKETADSVDLSVYDYVVDAIDTVSAKIELIERCSVLNIPLISSMGAGNKINPFAFEVTDIYKTSVCPLARVMRYELKKRNIPSLKVVYSKEKPLPVSVSSEESQIKKRSPGSIAFVPSVVGLLIASEVVKDLLIIT
ncbi:MAG: tRNA threonylcarbamoyladenosine dehydratase [Spirochaetaceae bacterium]|nr:tRNA threonylcarbamoyladenosine dehydratase [Spirochaetaceae bacterium]